MILYEDQYCLVINKPSGLICHPVGHYQGDTLLSRLQFYFGKEVRVVHRLDQETSGIMVFARTLDASQNFYRQFENRIVSKSYLALVEGKMTTAEGVISMPIAPELPDSAIKIKMRVGKEGLPSQTYYKVLSIGDSESLLYLIPHTGRKHQIRLHLSSLGYPVVGDSIYQHGGLPFLWEQALFRPSPWRSSIVQGNGLHAYSIEFRHPSTKMWMKFVAPPPRDWASLMPKQLWRYFE